MYNRICYTMSNLINYFLKPPPTSNIPLVTLLNAGKLKWSQKAPDKYLDTILVDSMGKKRFLSIPDILLQIVLPTEELI